MSTTKLYAFICCLGLLISGSGCIGSSPTVVFTLPNSFSGLVLIAEDRVNGVDLPRKDGEYFVEVPESGKLMVKSLRPLTDWHKEVAHFNNGRKLPTEGVYDGNEIGLFSITYIAGKGVFYFVGSRTDYNKICGIKGIEKLPLATNITAQFDKSEPTIHEGEDLDVPTYIRRGVALN